MDLAVVYFDPKKVSSDGLEEVQRLARELVQKRNPRRVRVGPKRWAKCLEGVKYWQNANGLNYYFCDRAAMADNFLLSGTVVVPK